MFNIFTIAKFSDVSSWRSGPGPTRCWKRSEVWRCGFYSRCWVRCEWWRALCFFSQWYGKVGKGQLLFDNQVTRTRLDTFGCLSALRTLCSWDFEDSWDIHGHSAFLSTVLTTSGRSLYPAGSLLPRLGYAAWCFGCPMIAEDDVIPYHKEPILELTGADSTLIFFKGRRKSWELLPIGSLTWRFDLVKQLWWSTCFFGGGLLSYTVILVKLKS